MKMIDLFAGIGVASLAAEKVWGKVEHEMVEIDPYCRTILKKHFPKAKIHNDIREYHYTGEPVDLVWGSPPCQAASSAGKRKGTDDSRWLWPDTFRVIKETQPKYWVLENVRGLLSLESGVVFDSLLAEMEKLGYEVGVYIVPACAVNAPHRRDRVWIIGRKNAADTKCERLQKFEQQNNTKDRKETETRMDDRLERQNCIIANTQGVGRKWAEPKGSRSGEPEKEAGNGNCATPNVANTKGCRHGGCAGKQCSDGRQGILSREQTGCAVGCESERCGCNATDSDSYGLQIKRPELEAGRDRSDSQTLTNSESPRLERGKYEKYNDSEPYGISADTTGNRRIRGGEGAEIEEGLQPRPEPVRKLESGLERPDSHASHSDYKGLERMQEAENFEGGRKITEQRSGIESFGWNGANPDWNLDWREVAFRTCVRGMANGTSKRFHRLTDGTGISGSRLRKERLKALGNSLVLQNVIKIFEAIKYAELQ